MKVVDELQLSCFIVRDELRNILLNSAFGIILNKNPIIWRKHACNVLFLLWKEIISRLLIIFEELELDFSLKCNLGQILYSTEEIFGCFLSGIKNNQLFKKKKAKLL